MSDQLDDTGTEELGPRPVPTVEKPDLYPGGADADFRDPDGAGLPRDLDPAKNPATEQVPEEVLTHDETDTPPTGQEDQDIGAEDPAAGQVASDGSPEPPA